MLTLVLALLLVARPVPQPSVPVDAAPNAAGSLRVATGLHPTINASGCVFLPDLGHPRPFACGDSNGGIQFNYVGQPLGLNLTVSDPDGSPIHITVWWDVQLNFSKYPFLPELVNESAVQSFDVTPSGAGQPVNLTTAWTYPSPGAPLGGLYTGYHVYVNASNANGYDIFRQPAQCNLPWGNCYFDIAVAAANLPPSAEGLQSSYTYKVLFPNWTVPDFVANITVTDADDDPVTVTWDWGDGTVTVNRTPPALLGIIVVTTHRYVLALNDTPWVYDFTLNLSVDDGVAGHNVTTPIAIQYYVGLDAPPSATVIEPTGVLRLVVGRNVTFTGMLSDFEADPIQYYWDFGDGSNTSLTGPVFNGSVSIQHVYSRDGNYSARLWATDGLDKRLCLGTDCTRTHWVNSTKDVLVHPNSSPIASLTISSNPYTCGRPAGFATATYDLDGDPMVVTWVFGDGTLAFNWTAENRTQNDLLQYHVYDRWGDPAKNYTYNVTVWVDDGWGHNVSRSTDIFIGSLNAPPNIAPELLLVNDTARANEVFRLEVNVTDPEGDPVNVTVDFGDGLVAPFLGAVNTSLWLNHSYSVAGTYTINITATDDKLYVFLDNKTGLPNATAISHVVRMSIVVDVTPPVIVEGPDVWTWWDYVTLSAVLAIPAVYLARAGYLRRIERRED